MLDGFQQLIHLFGVGAVVVPADAAAAVDNGKDVAVEDATGCGIAFNGCEEVPVAGEVVEVLFFARQQFPDFRVLPESLSVGFQL